MKFMNPAPLSRSVTVVGGRPATQSRSDPPMAPLALAAFARYD